MSLTRSITGRLLQSEYIFSVGPFDVDTANHASTGLKCPVRQFTLQNLLLS